MVKNLNQDSIKDLVKTPSNLPRSNPSDSSPMPGTISTNSFSSLEKFLANKDWESSNTYTMKILIEMADSSRPNRDFNQDWLEPEDIESLSCSGLRTIDNLWSTASNKRFGFTAQSEIWKKVRGATKTQPDNPEIRKKFSSLIGWIGADRGQFDLNKLNSKIVADFKSLPQGYLPSSLGKYVGSQIWVGNLNEFATLTSKLKKCKISQN